MCDPVTLGIGAAMSLGGKLIGGSESRNAAGREAAARNAQLEATLAKERGFAADNAKQFEGNIGNYAPGKQDEQLAAAQDKRTGNMTGAMTMADPNAVPLTADAPAAVRGEIAKRLVAAHDGAVERAKLNGTVGGYGDSWFKNALNTSEADRNIGVTNNFANGEKAILPAMQDLAAASVYKPPSIWGPLLSGAGSLVAGASGAGAFGEGGAFSGPAWGGGSIWDGSAWGGSKMFPLEGLSPSDYG
jgi:hypothetical protein